MTFRLPVVKPAKRPFQQLSPIDASQSTNTKLLPNPIPTNNSVLLIPARSIPLSKERVYLQNMAMYTNPIPTIPNWTVLTPINKVRVALSDASDGSEFWLFNAVAAPTIPIDWGKPRVPNFTAVPTYPNIALAPVAVSAPVVPYDTNRPSVNVYLAPVIYPNRVLGSVPVIPVDWGKQQQNPNFQPVPQYPNLNINTVGSPIVPLDWSRQQQNPNFQPVPLYPNISLNTVVVQFPFYTQDFSKPFVPTPGKVDQQSVNLQLYTNPIPFAQLEWGKTSFRVYAPDQTYSNTVLLNPVIVQNPFYTQDFSRPFVPVPAKQDQQSLNLQLYTNPIPFGPYDYSSRFVDRFTPVDQNGVPNLVLSNFSTPFVSYDWSKPLAVKAAVDPQYPNVVILQPVGAPFSQLDWSKAYTITPRSSNQNDLPNLLLIQPSSPSNPLGIFGWIDWSRTQKPIIIVPDQNNLPNIVLPNTTPIPPEPPIVVGGKSSKWIDGVEAMRRKAHQQALSNNIAIREAAAVLSKMGGIARAKSLTSTQRSKIATVAAKARWAPKR